MNPTDSESAFKLSVIVPVFNEVENVPILWGELCRVLRELDFHCEVVWVDDASTDGTFTAMQSAISSVSPPSNCAAQLLQLTRNSGQSAALGAGLHAARGELIVTMDGDLQSDPADIPKLLSHLTDNVDLVAGWRRSRQDTLLFRRFPSLVANWALQRITRIPVHDLGCSLRVVRASVLKRVPMYGDRHRYLVPLCAANGAAITEVEVNHRLRQFGKSKYGLSRTFRVLLDSISLRLFVRFWKRPLHLFGSMGLPTAGLGVVICIYLSYLKLRWHVSIGSRPLLLLGVLLIVLGAQFLCFGLLAEIMVRIYEERKTIADDPLRAHQIVEGSK